jgi:hypothetical protein
MPKTCPIGYYCPPKTESAQANPCPRGTFVPLIISLGRRDLQFSFDLKIPLSELGPAGLKKLSECTICTEKFACT